MLKVLGWIVKLGLFTLVVLILGNWFQYKGRTLSDQVKTGMAQAERSSFYREVKGWAKQVTTGPGHGIQKSRNAPKTSPDAHVGRDTNDEDLPASERQKLKALIHELNGSDR